MTKVTKPQTAQPIKVRVCWKETATGESYTDHFDLEALTLEALVKAFDAKWVEMAKEDGLKPDVWQGKAWVPSATGETFAFIAMAEDVPYFHNYLALGTVYTNFR